MTYASPAEARTAVRILNNYPIQPGKHIGVVASVDNRRLFVGNIPKERTKEEVKVSVFIITLVVRSTCLLKNTANTKIGEFE